EPMIRQRLRQQRIDLKHRRLDSAPSLGGRTVFEHGHPDSQDAEKCDKRGANKKITFHNPPFRPQTSDLRPFGPIRESSEVWCGRQFTRLASKALASFCRRCSDFRMLGPIAEWSEV